MSDNPDKQEWPTLRWPSDAEVIGEVKWAARTFWRVGGDNFVRIVVTLNTLDIKNYHIY